MNEERSISSSPEETFALGEALGRTLKPGDAVLLCGGLGAGKTLFTKGILSGLGYDIDEVTSPSFTLVNLYRTESVDVFHIDLWRLEVGANHAFAVGLDEIFENENAVAIIEWAERLGDFPFPGNVFEISIQGDGDDVRKISESEILTED